MQLDPAACYQALVSHDARFDGVFFVGVSSTGIYCRPICPARTPKPENCTFYPSAAAAQKAGYRPCRRCRPERAPGNAHADGTIHLARLAASQIEDGALSSENGVNDLAARVGVTARHLRRVVQAELGASPLAIAQTQRLLLARRLLTETDLPITEVALSSGFNSVRRFNALFKEKFQIPPSSVRKAAASVLPPVLTCELAYRPPLDWQFLSRFLTGRTVRGVESVEGDTYIRALRIGDKTGWVRVRPPDDTRRRLIVDVSASLAPVLPSVLAKAKQVFDLQADPQAIAAHLGTLAQARPGLRVPGAWNGFEMAVRAILGQQVSVAAATTLSGRLTQRFGQPIETPFAKVTHLTPTPTAIAQAAEDEIASLGIIGSRARSLIALAQAVESGQVVLEPTTDVDKTLSTLVALPGIGEWTAQYIAMRALSWPDAFPHTDLGIKKALGIDKPKDILALAEKWRPWRAYAVMHLWASLSDAPATMTTEKLP